jgi:uncharacterized Zn finger protein
VTAKDRPRFDVDALRELAGEKVFARGEAYHSEGQVQILSLEAARTLAQVAGTEDYRTVVTGHGREIGGECSCRAFVDWGFCKHMVATALAANAAGSDLDGGGALSRIREHLKGKSIDSLVKIIVDLAEWDAALFHKLDMASTAMLADDKTLESRLRRAIDGATRSQGGIDYEETSAWAAAVDSVLDTIAEIASAGRGGIALKLAERAIERIERALGEIDDSDGDCGTVLQRARDVHVAAIRMVKPDAVRLARDLFERETQGEYGTFDGAARLYADVLGEEGLAEYRRLAFTSWEKLPSRAGNRARQEEKEEGIDGDYDRLKDILDGFAERDGDLDARIALRSKDLSSSWHYLELAEFCRTHGRGEDALRWAEEGLWVFEDGRPDQRLVSLAAELLVEGGRTEDAEAHLGRAFEKAPSQEIYARLRALGGEAARDRAVTFLEARLVDQAPARWLYSADLLVSILEEEKMFDAAWTAALKYGASLRVKEALAEASAATHPREALEVYAERVGELIGNGSNQAYVEAVALIARMATLRSAAEHAAYLAEIKMRFGRKRNFMKLLG